jgi:hypothetical protein
LSRLLEESDETLKLLIRLAEQSRLAERNDASSIFGDNARVAEGRNLRTILVRPSRSWPLRRPYF